MNCTYTYKFQCAFDASVFLTVSISLSEKLGLFSNMLLLKYTFYVTLLQELFN